MRIFIITFISLLGTCSLLAQEAKFTVEVSTDSILLGNHLEVIFSIENGNAQNFEAPGFQGFAVVGGPNQSSSYSMFNGVTTQSRSYSYYIEPQEEGVFFIEPASVEIDGEILETSPIEIKVAPNPEGIIQNPNRQKSRTFDSFFDRPIFPEKEIEKTKPKKKRKIYKI
ncbi:MAG: hypothetical protein ACI8VT_002083 [Saprospiraceae bacterium]|jgi:hypothetical protein